MVAFISDFDFLLLNQTLRSGREAPPKRTPVRLCRGCGTMFGNRRSCDCNMSLCRLNSRAWFMFGSSYTTGERAMRKSILVMAIAGSTALTACASNPRIAQDAAIGGVGGAAVGAVVPGVSVVEGAAVGAAIGGLSGAIWADNNNDGYVDGYVYNGQYYAGQPSGYNPQTHSVLAGAATGALGGAALGAVAGAVIPGVSILQGAVIGAAVGGLTGAIWADRNNDGVVDGYVYNGQYYAGGPSATAPAPAPTYTAPARSGERG
jgi:hypothetical protein